MLNVALWAEIRRLAEIDRLWAGRSPGACTARGTP